MTISFYPKDDWFASERFHRMFIESAAEEIRVSASKYASQLGGISPVVHVNDRGEISVVVKQEDSPDGEGVMTTAAAEKGIEDGLRNIGRIVAGTKARIRAGTGQAPETSDIETLTRAQEKALS